MNIEWFYSRGEVVGGSNFGRELAQGLILAGAFLVVAIWWLS